MKEMSLMELDNNQYQKQLDTFVKALKTAFRLASKFLTLYLAYVLTNLFLTVAFKQPVRLNMDLAQLISEGSTTILSNNLLGALAYLANLRYYLKSVTICVSALVLFVGIVCATNLCATLIKKQTVSVCATQFTKTNKYVMSYRQHVCFLS